MSETSMRHVAFRIVLVCAFGALALTAGCARQVRVESGPPDADTTDRDTSSLSVDARAVPVFEVPEAEALRR